MPIGYRAIRAIHGNRLTIDMIEQAGVASGMKIEEVSDSCVVLTTGISRSSAGEEMKASLSDNEETQFLDLVCSFRQRAAMYDPFGQLAKRIDTMLDELSHLRDDGKSAFIVLSICTHCEYPCFADDVEVCSECGESLPQGTEAHGITTGIREGQRFRFLATLIVVSLVPALLFLGVFFLTPWRGWAIAIVIIGSLLVTSTTIFAGLVRRPEWLRTTKR